MQKCPHCHNVLVSPLCCTHSHQQVPLVFSIDSGPLSPMPTLRPLVPTTIAESNCGTMDGCVEGSNEHSKCQSRMSLPTPHVSGHMFQFPTVNDMLVSRLNACQLTCHINCLTHGTFQYAAPSWTDNSLCNSHRRLSNGWAYSTSLSYDEEGACLEATKLALMKSGWYWAKLSWQEAEIVLQPTSIGTFLIRDSADPNHRFSLSVQTEKGPTSVRIQFYKGKFRLRCEASVKTALPEFSCVIKLIEHYVSTNEKHNNHVWVDSAGKIYSPIRICKPLRRKIPSLLHLSRLSINYHIPRSVTSHRLPPTLAKYLDEYPFWC